MHCFLEEVGREALKWVPDIKALSEELGAVLDVRRVKLENSLHMCTPASLLGSGCTPAWDS